MSVFQKEKLKKISTTIITFKILLYRTIITTCINAEIEVLVPSNNVTRYTDCDWLHHGRFLAVNWQQKEHEKPYSLLFRNEISF